MRVVDGGVLFDSQRRHEASSSTTIGFTDVGCGVAREAGQIPEGRLSDALIVATSLHDRLERDLEEKSAENTRLQDELARRDTELYNVRAELKDAKDANQQCEACVHALERDVAILRRAAGRAQDDDLRYREDLKENAVRISGLNSELENLRRELDASRATRSPASARKRRRESSPVAGSSTTPARRFARIGPRLSLRHKPDEENDLPSSSAEEGPGASIAASHHLRPNDPPGVGGSFFRPHINKVLSAQATRGIVKLAKPNNLGITQLAFFNWDRNIKAPMEPRQNGHIFVGLTFEDYVGNPGSDNCYELFIKYTDQQRQTYGDPCMKPLWRYMGTYNFERIQPVPVAEWLSFDSEFHKAWAYTDAGRSTDLKDKTMLEAHALTLIPEYNDGRRRVPQVSVKNIGFNPGLQQAILHRKPIYVVQ